MPDLFSFQRKFVKLEANALDHCNHYNAMKMGTQSWGAAAFTEHADKRTC